MRSWSRRRRIVVGASVVAGIWLALVGWLLLDARRAARHGADELRAFRRSASIAELLDPAGREHLTEARRAFDRAEGRLANPLLIPLRLLPVVARHLAAAERLAGASVGGTDIARGAVDDLQDLTDRPHDTGPERVALLRDLAALAERTDVALAEVDPGSPDDLVATLGDAVAEAGDARQRAREGVGHLRAVSTALADVLAGPEPYLLLGANNAEMRNGSGMFLSAATVTFDDGDLDLGAVSPTESVVLPAGTVPVSGDLAANWPWIDSGRDLRSLGLSADFPQSAPVAAANWAATPAGTDVAGVIVVDVDALRSLLRAVGPVEVGGVTYTADTVRGELLRDQYGRGRDQDERRDQVGAVAQAVFERLTAGAWELEEVATELAAAVQGRHLMIWSADRRAQDAWAAVAADGHLEADSVAVGLVNRSATKLDSWIDTSLALTTRRVANGTEVELRYQVTNRAPSSGSAYQVGPNVAGLAAGDHRALVVANLPGTATRVELTGARRFLDGADGLTLVVAGEVTVRRGETVTVTVTALLPPEVERMVLEPSARVPRTEVTVDGRTVEQDRRRTISLPPQG